MTPHQWRHTFATRLTDRNCPQEVIQRLLDHSSPAMVAIYAHLKDKKIRQEWEKATKVNSDGDVVTLDPTHPLNEAIWTNSRLGRATMALPNGYCGLPLTQNCETANQCLTCPMFLTTKDFLPQHRRQRSETARLIAVAEGNGQFRMVQTNTDGAAQTRPHHRPAHRRRHVTRADNSHHLITAARTRSRSTRERSLAALQTMIDTGQEVTFEAVATTAGVSRSWLYNATDLRDRIIELRAATRPPPRASPAHRQPATEASLLTRLEVDPGAFTAGHRR